MKREEGSKGNGPSPGAGEGEEGKEAGETAPPQVLGKGRRGRSDGNRAVWGREERQEGKERAESVSTVIRRGR